MVYPFRLGSTSYIIPADIISNTAFLSNRLDDIELVLFETPGESNLPSPLDIELMQQTAIDANLTFTIHLPTDKKIEIGDQCSIDTFVQSICKTIQLVKPLNPFAYVLHLEGIYTESKKKEIDTWQKSCFKMLHDLLEKAAISTHLLCIENLAYPWSWYRELAQEYRTSYCLDIGHLWATNPHDWEHEAMMMIDNSRVIHLHGLCSKGDHCSLAQSDPLRTELFLRLVKLKLYNHVITLEVFNETDLDESIDCVRNIWEKLYL